MPSPADLSSASLAMAAGISLIAAFLGLREWYERRARETDLSDADRLHFARQDLRRSAGVGVIFAIVLILLVSAALEPKIKGRANLIFIELWVVALGLIVVLLVLALFDWAGTRTYARRQRRQIIRESLAGIRKEVRSIAASTRESPDTPAEPPAPNP
jgi:hypothetical protein